MNHGTCFLVSDCAGNTVKHFLSLSAGTVLMSATSALGGSKVLTTPVHRGNRSTERASSFPKATQLGRTKRLNLALLDVKALAVSPINVQGPGLAFLFVNLLSYIRALS